MSDFETVWTFETRNFTVALEVEPEVMDPADSFQFQEDIDAVRNGEVDWFAARVSVYGPNGARLGFDCLGGCAYKTVREFYTLHREHKCRDYFGDMVREAIRDARVNWASLKDAIHLRNVTA